MRYPVVRANALAPAAILAAALLAACSGDSTSPTSNPNAMTTQEANAAADVVVDDMGDEVEGATSTNVSTGFYVSSAQAGVALSAGPRPWWLSACTPAPTKTVSADGFTTTWTFNNCTISRLIPLQTIVRNGVVAVTRQTGLWQLAFTNFKKETTLVFFRSGTQVTLSNTRTGTRKITKDDGTVLTHEIFGATPSDGFRTDFVGPDGGTGTHLRKWSSTFTADVASTIAVDTPLPAGKWALNGSSEWTRTKDDSTKTWSFQAQTGADGVHYNPACDAPGPQFDSGTLTLVATNKKNETTTIQISFTACGQYTVTKT